MTDKRPRVEIGKSSKPRPTNGDNYRKGWDYIKKRKQKERP